MGKKTILWITADYFVDVDFSVVPYLQTEHNYEIIWIVIKGKNSKIVIDNSLDCKVYNLNYRTKDPRIISDYFKIISSYRRKKIDFIYSDYVGTPYYFFLLQLLFKSRPIIHAAHNVIPYDGWPDKRLTSFYLHYIFKSNKHFHFFSRFTALYFNERYSNKKSFCCPLSLKDYGEIRTNNYEIDKTKLNLLFFGNIKANKRLDLLVGAIIHLPNEIKSKIHLSICGKCDELIKYENLIAGCNSISAYFKRISDEDIPELFTKHDYLVLPYQDVAQSGPHMIAYNYNLPVIASDIEGFRERICDKENGFLFEPGNMEALINVLESVVRMDSDSYQYLKFNLKKYVEDNFSLEKISMNYIAFFNSIIK